MERDEHPQITTQELLKMQSQLGNHILEQLTELQNAVEELRRLREQTDVSKETKAAPEEAKPASQETFKSVPLPDETLNEQFLKVLLMLNVRTANTNDALLGIHEDIGRILGEVRNNKVAIYDLWESLSCCITCNKCCRSCCECCTCDMCYSECKETCGLCCKFFCTCCIDCA